VTTAPSESTTQRSRPVRALTPRELGKLICKSDRTVRSAHANGTLGFEGRIFGSDLRFPPGPVAEFLGITVDELMDSLGS